MAFAAGQPLTAAQLNGGSWVAVTPQAGFTGTVNVCILGNTVIVQGAFSGTININTNTAIGTVPAGYRPQVTINRAAENLNTGLPCVAWVGTDGVIWARKSTASGTSIIDVSALSGYQAA